MLVLHRRPREKVCLVTPDGFTIWIQVNEAAYNSCRLGFTAAPEVRILREEVFRTLYPNEPIPYDDGRRAAVAPGDHNRLD